MEAVKEEGKNTDDDEEEEEEEDEGEEDEIVKGGADTEGEATPADQRSTQPPPMVVDDQDTNTPKSNPILGISGSQKAAHSEITADISSISDKSQRELSRSPPRSRSISPQLEKMTAWLSIDGIKDIVSSDLTKARARQHRKYHSKRGARNAGRPQGSKAKQDTRVKIDQSGVWD